MAVERLHFTDSDAANALIAADPMALLVGFALDQQVTVQKAFMGPLVIRERIGSLDARALAEADLEQVFREKPAVHRFPGAMAARVHDLAAHILERYDGRPARIWQDAATAAELRANLAALPGFGDMKVVSLAAVLARRFDVAAAAELIPDHPPSATSTHRRRWRRIRPASAPTRPRCGRPRLDPPSEPPRSGRRDSNSLLDLGRVPCNR